MQDTNYPIQGKHAFYALLETQGSKQEHDQEVIKKKKRKRNRSSKGGSKLTCLR